MFAKRSASRPLRRKIRDSSGRRAIPNRLSGSLATQRSASTSSTVRSTGVWSGFSFGFFGSFGLGGGFGFGGALAPSGCFLASTSSSSSFLRDGPRGPGFVVVAVSDRYTTLRSLMPHAEASPSGREITYEAGFPSSSLSSG